jgi:hypothetical protein
VVESVGSGDVGGRGNVAERKAGAVRKQANEYRLTDARLDGTLDAWPPEPPRLPRTAVEAARLALIEAPGQVHVLAWKFSDVGRASKLASSFKRAKPSKLSPAATGSFDARAFFDLEAHKWRIAARYLPAGEHSAHSSTKP